VALHPDRLFPVEAGARAIARRLYAEIATLPIVSPHGHTDPRWYAETSPFRSGHALRQAGPLHLPHALLAGRLAGAARHRTPGRRAGAERSTRSLAHLCPALALVPWHPDPALARALAGGPCSGSPSGSGPRTRTGSTTASRTASPSRTSAPGRSTSGSTSRSSRPRIPRSTTCASTIRSGPRAGRAGWCRPTGPTPWSIRISRASPRTWRPSCGQPASTPSPGRTTWRHIGKSAPSSRSAAPRRPTTAIPPPEPPTSASILPRLSSRPLRRGAARPRSASCSAHRC
jgi:hypothetical protein